MSRASPENLFRRTALRALTEQPLGRPVCRVPSVWAWITALLVTAFLAAVVLAPHIEWHRTEGVRGWLVPESGVVRIASPSAGVVTDHSVMIGRQVEAGKVLATISTDLRGRDGDSRHRQDRALIEAALAESEIREVLLAERYTLRIEGAEARSQTLHSERESIAQQILFEDRRRDIEEQRFAKLQSAGSAVPAWEILKQEEALAGRRSAIEELRQRAVRIDGELQVLRAEIDAAPLEADLARSELLARRTTLQRELGNSDTEIALVAPVAGQVADTSLAVGDQVKPGTVLVSILPEGGRLQAELYVPSRSAAHLRNGQGVRLFIDAWPREKFGAIGGTVERIADFVGGTSHDSGNGAYRVVVSLDETQRVLRPGMSLGAELLLERRDLVDWIVGPLRSRFGTGLSP